MPAPDHWGNGWPYAANGAIAASAGTAAPAHWSNGRPFDAGGALAVEYGAAVTQRGRLPFTANGRVAIGGEELAADHYQGGVAYTSDGRLAVSREAPATWVNGLPLAADGRLAMQDYLIHLPLRGTLEALGASLTPTYSGVTANRLVLDHDGVWRYVNAGEPRFWGWRRVENTAPSIGGAFASPWSKQEFSGSAKVTEYGDNGFEIKGDPDDSDFRGWANLLTTSLRANVAGATWAVSCEVFNVYGLEDVTNEFYMLDVVNTTNTVPDNQTRTAEIGLAARGRWVRVCAIMQPGADADGQIRFGVGTGSAKTTGSRGLHVRFRNFQLEEIGGASVQCCSEYIDPDSDELGIGGAVTGVKYLETANGNTLDTATGIVTEAAGAALSTMKGMLFEPARQNMITGGLSTWTPLNCTIESTTAEGPDGRKVWVTIDDGTDLSAFHRIYKSATVVNADDRVIVSVCARRAAGSDTALSMQVTNGGGNSFQAVFDLDVGGVIFSSDSGLATLDSAGYVALGGGWFWCWIAGQADSGAVGDTTVSCVVGSAKDDGSFDAIDGANRQIDLAMAMAQDTGASTLVAQFPHSWVANGSWYAADKTVDFGDVSGVVDGALWSLELSRFQGLNDASAFPQNDRYVGLNSAFNTGYGSYTNTNSRQVLAYNGTAGPVTAADDVADFAPYKLRRRSRVSHETGVATYHGDANAENNTVDATPIAVGDFTIGNLYVSANVGAPYMLTGVTIWGGALGQAWAEEGF